MLRCIYERIRRSHLQTFRKINAELGTTFIIITHDRRIAEQTNRIVEIKDGRIVLDVRN
jgi:lipoprotein-releasing system ATP-binding protein